MASFFYSIALRRKKMSSLKKAYEISVWRDIQNGEAQFTE
jgi:hypothetical protein